MSGRDPGLYLDDALDAIQAIRDFVEGMSFDEFRNDRKTLSATIREFIVIGEAIARLMELLEAHLPDYPWRLIKDFRNVIVHEYFGVDERIVWDAVHLELDDVEQGLRKLKSILNH